MNPLKRKTPLCLAIPMISTNRFKNNISSTEHYDWDLVSSDEMVKEFETSKVRQLFNTSMVVSIYFKTEGRIAELSLKLFPKR